MRVRRAIAARTIGASITLLALTPLTAQTQFIRGDTNTDGEVNIADAVNVFTFLFQNIGSFRCLDAADANDDGETDISDGLRILNALFVGLQPPPAPFPACGTDPTGDALDCAAYAHCLPDPPPSVRVTPLEIDFGPVGIGVTSPPQSIQITNRSNRTLNNFAGGAPPDVQFQGSQNCAGGVPPGGSCQYTFTFTPAAVGEFETISLSSTNMGPFGIRMRGTGVGPSLSVSPLSIDFGNVSVGQKSSSHTITIRNTGLSTLTNFAGGVPPDTQFQGSQNCAGGVPPGASCQYTFTFEPDARGTYETVSSSSTNAGPFEIAMRGFSSNRGAIVSQSVSPLVLDFGPIGVGFTSAPQVVTVRNTGFELLTDFAGGGPTGNQFSATQSCAGGVPVRGSCQFFYRFAPTRVGEAIATSTVSTNAGRFTIELRGTGIGAGVWATPLALDFGPVPVGETSAAQSVRIANTGLATLANFAGGAPNGPYFSALQNCAGGVAPGANCEFTYRFNPTRTGVFEATSLISTNAGSVAIRMRGRGVP